MTVNQPRIRLLIDALRSGEFPQARGRLCALSEDGTVSGYCCLGVATEVARRNGLDVTVNDNGRLRTYDGRGGALPSRIAEWYGLPSDNPPLQYGGAYHNATELNDGLCLALPEIGDAFERTFLTGDDPAGPPR